MGAVTVQAKYEKTTDPRRMLTHALLNEAIRTDWAGVKGFLPARTATLLSYEPGAKKANVCNEGESKVTIDLPLKNGWYVPDGNPFAIPNGRQSNAEDPDALYLYRYQDRNFSGPVGRGGFFDDGRRRVVYAFNVWSVDSGVALVGRDANVAEATLRPLSAGQSGATTPPIEVSGEKLATVANPQQLRQDAAQLRQVAANLQERFNGWDQALAEVVKPILDKAARFIEVAEAIEQARKA